MEGFWNPAEGDDTYDTSMFDDMIPDIPAGSYDEGDAFIAAEMETPGPTGAMMYGSAAAATSTPGASFSGQRGFTQRGPSIGASFLARDGSGGIDLSISQEGLVPLIEAAQGALAEIQRLTQAGQQPKKFATCIALKVRPNPNFRQGTTSPLGFIEVASRGAIKSEQSAQVARVAVGQDQTVQNAMGIIASSAPVADVGPRYAVGTTAAAAVRTVAPTPVAGPVSLINMG